MKVGESVTVDDLDVIPRACTRAADARAPEARAGSRHLLKSQIFRNTM